MRVDARRFSTLPLSNQMNNLKRKRNYGSISQYRLILQRSRFSTNNDKIVRASVFASEHPTAFIRLSEDGKLETSTDGVFREVRKQKSRINRVSKGDLLWVNHVLVMQFQRKCFIFANEPNPNLFLQRLHPIIPNPLTTPPNPQPNFPFRAYRCRQNNSPLNKKYTM